MNDAQIRLIAMLADEVISAHPRDALAALEWMVENVKRGIKAYEDELGR